MILTRSHSIVLLRKQESGRTWPAWAMSTKDGAPRFAWIASTKGKGQWRTKTGALPSGVVVDSRATRPVADQFRAIWNTLEEPATPPARGADA